ncbi:MAG: fumarylacetoacetate hydrolase [Rhodospirillaceae bacterium]|nr:fumarylacetoacetate hydrolase [Rhodospirillaceae bacterium]
MKLAFFDDFKLGVLKGDGLIDVSAVVSDIPHIGPGDLMSGLIACFDHYREKIDAAIEAGVVVPMSSVRIRPPVPKPGKIDCMAVNYMEDGTLEEKPLRNGFHKAPSAIIGDGDTMVLPDIPATIFEGEAELALVIGRTAKNISEAEAMDYIFGYMNFIDGSARGLPPDRNVFFQVKSRETFAPIGPFLVTADEIDNPQDLPVKLWVNGEVKQNFNTSDMAHKISELVAWLSSIHTLEVGDIVATGTNHRGLSAFQDGDKVELEVSGLGRLKFNVKDDLKRTWSRETRLDRQNQGHSTPTPQLTGKYAPGGK